MVVFLLGTMTCFLSAAAGEPSPPAIAGPAGKSLVFETDLEPLFQSRCIRCHGEKVQKGELNLASRAALLKGGESGPVVVPGKPDESLLFELVRDGAMPADKKDKLTPLEVALVRDWIAQGARFRDNPASDSPRAASEAPTQHDVIPILLRRCTVCHGLHEQAGGLDLRTPAALLRGGKSGPAIVPGKSGESLILKRIRSGDMPPRARLVEVSIKPIEPAETELLARWIEAGAPEVPAEPDVATTEPDPLVSDEDRNFWAFQPPRAAPVPTVRRADRVRNPIDAFLLHALEARGLTLSPEASRSALLRRVALDLTGLPPEPEDVRAFLGDTSPNAYEELVDRLLGSPQYAERWARHWLDVAGYGDTEGKTEQDLSRKQAYRYRDYVIRAFAADKPYDRFLREQIAGDELADAEHAPELTDELYDNLVATGFLRMAPDPTWANITGFIPDRLDVIADEIDVLASAVLGLTIKCARCHTHKFDPIPHRDYFRLLAVFKGAYDEHDWLKSGNVQHRNGQRLDRHLALARPAERREWEAHTARLDQEIATLRQPLAAQADERIKKEVDARLARLPQVLHDDLRTMLATPADKRTEIQKYLAAKFEKELRIDAAGLKQIDPEFKKLSDETDAKVAALNATRRDEPGIRALWDRGAPSPTYLLRRGDYLSPGRLIGPGVLSVLTDGRTPFVVTPPWPGANKTGRRLAFAHWLTRGDHPLTARVMVNRIWMHHFGAGLVRTPSNFGKAGERPTHPELLDWLAVEFVRQNWSIKAMHRLMVLSEAYRQGSTVTPELAQRDPDNRWLSRMPLRRVDAEVLYDSLLHVSGRLDPQPFGPADALDVRPDGLVTPRGTERGWRRAIYVQQQRKHVVTLLDNFDLPAMNPNCIERRQSTVAPQALHLMNNAMVQDLAARFAGRVARGAGADFGAQVEQIYLSAFCRLPQPGERAAGAASLQQLTEQWKTQAPAGSPDDPSARSRALTTFCHAILNSAEFLYVD